MFMYKSYFYMKDRITLIFTKWNTIDTISDQCVHEIFGALNIMKSIGERKMQVPREPSWPEDSPDVILGEELSYHQVYKGRWTHCHHPQDISLIGNSLKTKWHLRLVAFCIVFAAENQRMSWTYSYILRYIQCFWISLWMLGILSERQSIIFISWHEGNT